MSSVKTTLMITMDVMGINTIPRSVSMRISPGKRPNQLKAQGANCSIAPMTSSRAPAIMIHFPMFSVPTRYLIPLQCSDHYAPVGPAGPVHTKCGAHVHYAARTLTAMTCHLPNLGERLFEPPRVYRRLRVSSYLVVQDQSYVCARFLATVCSGPVPGSTYNP
jgi:hypothetical protein